MEHMYNILDTSKYDIWPIYTCYSEGGMPGPLVTIGPYAIAYTPVLQVQ